MSLSRYLIFGAMCASLLLGGCQPSANVTDHFQLSARLAQAGFREEANYSLLAGLDRVMQSSPQFRDMAFESVYLGFTRMVERREKEAAQHFEKALPTLPLEMKAPIQGLAALLHARLGNKGQAVFLAQDLLNIPRMQSVSEAILAYVNHEYSRVPELVDAVFTSFPAVNPTENPLEYALGLIFHYGGFSIKIDALVRTGDYKRAANVYETSRYGDKQIREDFPTLLEIIPNLAASKDEKEKWGLLLRYFAQEGSFADIEAIWEKIPNKMKIVNSPLFTQMAEIYLANNRSEKSVQFYSQLESGLTEKKSKFGLETYLLAARAAIRSGEYKKAKMWVQAALQEYPNNHVSNLFFGALSALSVSDKSLMIQFLKQPLYDLAREGYGHETLKILSRLTNEEIQSTPELYASYIRALRLTGNKLSARPDLLKSHPLALKEIGLYVWHEDRDTRAALPYLEAANKQLPSDFELAKGLFKLYVRAGDNVRAVQVVDALLIQEKANTDSADYFQRIHQAMVVSR